jgi:antirestriction protein ArdC
VCHVCVTLPAAEVLENDNRAVFTAASHAQRAAEFLSGLAGRQPATAGSLEPVMAPAG